MPHPELKLPRRWPSKLIDARKNPLESVTKTDTVSNAEANPKSSISLPNGDDAENRNQNREGDDNLNETSPTVLQKDQEQDATDSTSQVSARTPAYTENRTHIDGDDDDEDITCVTSNQDKSIRQEAIVMPSSAISADCIKMARWCAGDKPSMCCCHLSTSPANASHRSSGRNRPVDAPSNPDIEDNLKSKPGLVAFQRPEDEEGAVEDTSREGNFKPVHRTSTSIFTSSSFSLTKERVRAHMFDYWEDYDSLIRQANVKEEHWDTFLRQYFTEDLLWIRSSGNSLDRKGLKTMMLEDCVWIRMAIVSIDSIQLLAGGQAAVVVFTADQLYMYKGQQERDRTVLTNVLHVVNGCEILIGHEHRCPGMPIPTETRWK